MCRSNLITLCPAVPIVNDLLSASLYDTVSDIVEKLVQLGSSFQSGFRVLKMVLYEHILKHLHILSRSRPAVLIVTDLLSGSLYQLYCSPPRQYGGCC